MSACPWCEDEEYFEESLIEGADDSVLLELECSYCGRDATYHYGCNIDFQEYAEENSLLFSGVCCPECHQDMYDEDGTPYDEIEIQMEDVTYGILYTFQAELFDNGYKSPRDLLSQEPVAEVNCCDKQVSLNVSKKVVALESVEYLNVYIDFLIKNNKSLETLMENLWSECTKQDKKGVFEVILIHTILYLKQISMLDLGLDASNKTTNVFDEIRSTLKGLLGENHPFEALLKIEDTPSALEIAKNIKDVKTRSKALAVIVSTMADTPSALEVANSIEDEDIKSKALAEIISKIEDIQSALDMINDLKGNQDKIKALSAIAKKTEDVKLLKNMLKIVKNLESWNTEKLKIVTTIVEKTEDQKLLKYAIGTIRNMNFLYNDRKMEVLLAIIAKTEDKALFKSIISVLKNLPKSRLNNSFVTKVLVAIVENTDDGEMLESIVLMVDNNSSDDYLMAEVLIAVVENTSDKVLLQTVLDVAYKMGYDQPISKVLIAVMETTNDKNLLQSVLKIIDKMNEEEPMTAVLTAFMEATDNKKLREAAKEVAIRNWIMIEQGDTY